MREASSDEIAEVSVALLPHLKPDASLKDQEAAARAAIEALDRCRSLLCEIPDHVLIDALGHSRFSPKRSG